MIHSFWFWKIDAQAQASAFRETQAIKHKQPASKFLMKTNMIRNLISSAVIAAAIVAGALLEAGAATWTGAASPASKLWSEPNNWDTLLAPSALMW